CLWGKARGLLTEGLKTSVTVPKPEAWINVHAEGYSEEKKNTIREVFDADVVVPELEKVFAGRFEFYTINADENKEILKKYRLPSLVLFSGGDEIRVLEGIKAWNQYLEALSCL
ncbi:MAG: hypothetical protein RMI01_10570, partial [Thermodesulfovibrio sp.]|nr:hypothetical protein [Thermodesulfovibrio sp.]